MPAFKSKPAKGKPTAQVKGAPRSKGIPAPEPADDEDDENDEDDDDIDEDLDEIDEDVSLDEEDIDEDSDEDEDDDDDDDESEDEDLPPAKKQKLNRKEAVKEKSNDKTVKDKQKNLKKEADKKETKKKAAKEATTDDAESTESKEKDMDKQPTEDRAAAVGPLTDAETEMFADNFRAMSATSVFVGKLPEDATEEDLKKLHPAIRVVRRPVTRKGLPRTFAFLNFPNKETADRALKEINSKAPVKIRGQEVLVSENGNGQCHPPGLVDRRKLKIYGCPKHVSKEEIQKKMGCVDVLLSERDKGHAIEAVAVYRTSAEAKEVLDSHQTVTLNEAICAIFYLNISHNVKQHERKKDRKQQIKKEIKERKARAKSKAAEEGQGDNGNAGDDDDDDDIDEDENGEDDSGEENSTHLKSAKKADRQSIAKVGSAQKMKRPAPESDEDDDDDDENDEDDDEEEEESPVVRKKSNKKVSMKTPQRTPTKGVVPQKKSPRKGTPFKHNGFGSKPQAKKMKV